MKRVSIALAFCALLASSAVAQFGGMFPGPGTVHTTGGGVCSQATTFLARTSGLSGTETTAYQNMICGLVTDGIITGTLTGASGCGTGSFDALWVFASSSTTNANLNLCGTGLTVTVTGTCTFTADTGYTGDGSTCFLNTAYNPSTFGGGYTLNSASAGACQYTTGGPGGNAFGAGPGFSAWDVGGAPSIEINSFNQPVAPGSGNVYAARTASTSINVYLNGALSTTPADGVNAVPTSAFYFLAFNNAGTTTSFSAGKVGYGFFGPGFNATQVGNIYTRLHAFLVAVSAAAGC